MENQTSVVTPPETNTHKAKPSLLGMIANPGEQFERIKENPRFWVPLILVTLLYIVGSILTSLVITIDMIVVEDELIGIITPEAMLTSTKAGIIGFSVVLPIIMVLIYSFVQLIITNISQTGVRFKQLLSMNIFVYVVVSLGVLLNGIVIYVTGTNPIEIPSSTSLGALIETEGMAGALNAIEVFHIWSLILVGIGLNKVGGLSKKASILTIIAFLVVSLISAAFGLFG